MNYEERRITITIEQSSFKMVSLDTVELAGYRTRINPGGVLLHQPGNPLRFRLDRHEARALAGYEGMFPAIPTGPETVHLEVSSRCSNDCSYCPSRNDRNEEELSSGQWKRIIRSLAKAQVIEVTLGGGDPFARDDIIHLAGEVKAAGMSVTTTARFESLQRWSFTNLARFDQVNISVRPADPGQPCSLPPRTYLTELARHTRLGFNVTALPGAGSDYRGIGEAALDAGAEIFLLSLKAPLSQPVLADANWTALLASRDLIRMGITVRLDCALVGRCAAGSRIATVRCNGSIMPCSFSRRIMGNLCHEDIRDIWQRAYTGERDYETFCPYRWKKTGQQQRRAVLTGSACTGV